jgi:CRISPR-associated protein (Cas_Cas02710)
VSNNNPIQRRIQAESFRRFAECTFGQKNFGWQAVLYTALLFIAGGWLPNGIADFVKYLTGDWSLWVFNYQLSGSVAILIYFGVLLSKVVHSPGKIEVSNDPPEPVKVLAVFLSSFNVWYNSQQSQAEIVKGKEKESLEKVLAEHTVKRETLDGTTWEMPLKAIEFHKSRIETLYLFTSSGSKGTTADSDLFVRLVKVLYPGISAAELVSGGLDFENLKEIFHAVEDLYSDAIASGYKEKDVLVDITGGKKTNSIAASIATLAAGRKFQYISEDKVVRSYDVGYFGA